jgi:hypothetical protein
MATGKQRGDDDASRREALLNADVRKEEWQVAAPAPAAGGDRPLGRRVLEESRLLWEIVAPAIFSRVATFSMNVITQAFAGHLGDLELAAISIANTVIVGFNFGLMVRTHVPPPGLAAPVRYHISLYILVANDAQDCIFSSPNKCDESIYWDAYTRSYIHVILVCSITESI